MLKYQLDRWHTRVCPSEMVRGQNGKAHARANCPAFRIQIDHTHVTRYRTDQRTYSIETDMNTIRTLFISIAIFRPVFRPQGGEI